MIDKFNKKILSFILILVCFILIKILFQTYKNPWMIIFKYPNWDINFSWEKLPDFENNYLVKEKFDKEFLNISYNFYQFFLYVKRLPLFMPFIEENLEKNSIPLDFKYLPIAESALKEDVVSGAWAAWIWQFVPETAKEYWLIINWDIDERYNFEKSTLAAIKYLNYLHTIFKNRTLVAASYNRWQNGIKNALKDQEVTSYYDLILNEETSRYVFKILAIKYVLKEYEHKKIYINTLIWWTYKPLKTKTITLNKNDDLQKYCKDNNIDYLEFKTLNRWILWDKLPEWNWEVKVPE